MIFPGAFKCHSLAKGSHTARSLGYVIASVRGGKLYDKRRGNRVMALVGMVVLLTLVPLLPNLVLLTVAILLIGIAEGALDIGGNTLLSHRE